MIQETFPDLAELINDGYIKARRHPDFPLFIYNYTAKTQYTQTWNPTTLACRGLIAHEGGTIIARPFAKFFNLEQVDALPNEPFEVYEKLDGSLGILYWHEGTPYVATRGSFDSEQAQKANRLLARYDMSRLNPAHTYLFEIIYPENRIVVDYAQREELILLAIIETDTGCEFPLADLGFPLPKRWHGVTDAASLKAIGIPNAEGFVLRFQSGLRVKVKLEEYVRLHKLLTGITEKTILEDYLSVGRDVSELMERVPDEFYQWVQEVVAKFTAEYVAIELEAQTLFRNTHAETRKEFALQIQGSPFASILFKMLDERPYDSIIWKMLRAETRAFRCDEEAIG